MSTRSPCVRSYQSAVSARSKPLPAGAASWPSVSGTANAVGRRPPDRPLPEPSSRKTRAMQEDRPVVRQPGVALAHWCCWTLRASLTVRASKPASASGCCPADRQAGQHR